MLIGLNQNGKQSDNPEPCGITRTRRLPVYRQNLSHSFVTYVKRGKPVSLPSMAGKQVVRQAERGAGIG